MGDPRALATDVGPVIDAEARGLIERHVQAMQAQGPARLASGAAPLRDRGAGHFVAPTVIELGSVAELGREVFGPVLHVVRYRARTARRAAGADQRHRLRPDPGRAHPHRRDGRAGGERVARRQRLRQPQHRRRGGRRAAVRRRRPVGHRPEGRRAAVPAAPAGRAAACRRRAAPWRTTPARRRPPVRGMAASGEGVPARRSPGGAARLGAGARAWALLAAQLRPGGGRVTGGPLDRVCPGPPARPIFMRVRAARSGVVPGGRASRSDADRLAQLAAVLAVGSHAVWPAAAQALFERLPAAVREHISLAQDWSVPAVSFDAALHHGSPASWLATAADPGRARRADRRPHRPARRRGPRAAGAARDRTGVEHQHRCGGWQCEPDDDQLTRPAGAARRHTAGAATVGLRFAELQQPHRVLFQDQRLDRILEAGFLEVRHPAVGRDQRVVAAEQDAVLQQRVRVLHELRRKVLRAPARQVDPDVGLVHRQRDRLVLPRPATGAR